MGFRRRGTGAAKAHALIIHLDYSRFEVSVEAEFGIRLCHEEMFEGKIEPLFHHEDKA